MIVTHEVQQYPNGPVAVFTAGAHKVYAPYAEAQHLIERTITGSTRAVTDDDRDKLRREITTEVRLSYETLADRKLSQIEERLTGQIARGLGYLRAGEYEKARNVLRRAQRNIARLQGAASVQNEIAAMLAEQIAKDMEDMILNGAGGQS